jgi:hypothetical protein
MSYFLLSKIFEDFSRFNKRDFIENIPKGSGNKTSIYYTCYFGFLFPSFILESLYDDNNNEENNNICWNGIEINECDKGNFMNSDDNYNPDFGGEFCNDNSMVEGCDNESDFIYNFNEYCSDGLIPSPNVDSYSRSVKYLAPLVFNISHGDNAISYLKFSSNFYNNCLFAFSSKLTSYQKKIFLSNGITDLEKSDGFVFLLPLLMSFSCVDINVSPAKGNFSLDIQYLSDLLSNNIFHPHYSLSYLTTSGIFYFFYKYVLIEI